MKVEIFVPLYKEETQNQKYLLNIAMSSVKCQIVKDYTLDVVCGYESCTPQYSIDLCEKLGFKVEECPKDHLTPGSPIGKYEWAYNRSKADFFSTCQNDDFFYINKTIFQYGNMSQYPNVVISIVGHSLFHNNIPVGIDYVHMDNEGVAGSIPSCWMINKHLMSEFPMEYKGIFNWDNVCLYKIMTYGKLLPLNAPLVIYNLHPDCTSIKEKIPSESWNTKNDAFLRYRKEWKGFF